MNLLDDLFGPIATIECRRALRPGWLRWLRMLAGVPAAGIALIVIWLWMLWLSIDSFFLPGELLGYGLLSVEFTQIVLALLLSPALIAGAIASEKDRGTLSMLLCSELTASDIILGRLAGCFSQVILLSVAPAPIIVLFAALRNAGLFELAMLMGLPAAVALGTGGIAVAASTLARRGRDALLATYLIVVLLLLGTFFAVQQPELAWLRFFNPFAATNPLVFAGLVTPAVIATALWLAVGSCGTLIAILQLHPSYRRQTGGQVRKRLVGRRWAPAMSDRPMLWKELYIESAGSLGAWSRWLIRLFVLLLGGGGAVVFGAVIWNYAHGDKSLPSGIDVLAMILALSATYVTWLIQWATGLRAAGVITGERLRSTWDAILVSPLEGREIIAAKVCGSLYALRYLALAACFAWSAAVVAEAMSIVDCAQFLAMLFAGSAFMAAVGVAVSMTGASSTRGMAITIGFWMAAAIGTSVLAAIMSALIMVLVALVAVPFAAANSSTQGQGMFTSVFWIWGGAYVVVRVALYLSAALLAIGWVLARFDSLAGRMGTVPLGQLAKRSYDSLTGAAVMDKSKGAPQ